MRRGALWRFRRTTFRLPHWPFFLALTVDRLF